MDSAVAMRRSARSHLRQMQMLSRPQSAPSLATTRRTATRRRARPKSSHSASPYLAPPRGRKGRPELEDHLDGLRLDDQLLKLKEVLRLKREISALDDEAPVRNESQPATKDEATQAKHEVVEPRREAVVKRLEAQLQFICNQLESRNGSGGTRSNSLQRPSSSPPSRRRNTGGVAQMPRPSGGGARGGALGHGARSDWIQTSHGDLELTWHPLSKQRKQPRDVGLRGPNQSEPTPRTPPWATTLAAVEKMPMSWKVQHGWRWSMAGAKEGGAVSVAADASVQEVLDLIVRREMQMESLREFISGHRMAKRAAAAGAGRRRRGKSRRSGPPLDPATRRTGRTAARRTAAPGRRGPEHGQRQECLEDILLGALRKKLDRAARSSKHGDNAGSPKERALALREELLYRIDYLRECTVELVEAVQSWRHRLALPETKPFMWLGANYVLKLATDLDALLDSTPELARLGVVPKRNPFLLDVTLDQMVPSGTDGVFRVESSRRPMGAIAVHTLGLARLRNAAAMVLREEEIHGIVGARKLEPDPHRRPLQMLGMSVTT